MKLGEKVGEGAGSEAFAWGDREIVKLFKPGVDRRVVEYESFVTRKAFEAGAPAPEVRGIIDVDGRPGIIFPRFAGESLLQMLIRGAISAGAAGNVMARLAHSLHAGRYRPSVRTFRTWVESNLSDLRRINVPEDVIEKVETALRSLPEGGVLCHGDLHAANILMTPGGPVAIDWISAIIGDPLIDVARQHVIFTLMRIEPDASEREDSVDGLTRARREADEAFIRTYAELSHVTPAELLAAITPYMVVMAAMRMLESASSDEERTGLTNYIRCAS
jgi:aminoglycoside phosphotransferase (APT) family kinase protein